VRRLFFRVFGPFATACTLREGLIDLPHRGSVQFV
jgi:hypothetical protein